MGVAKYNHQAPMWEGVENLSVEIRHRSIEVTAFGDAQRRFISGGQPTVSMHLDLDLRSYELLQGLLQTQGEFDPNTDHFVFRVAARDMANAVPGAERRPAVKAAPPLELKPVRMVSLDE